MRRLRRALLVCLSFLALADRQSVGQESGVMRDISALVNEHYPSLFDLYRHLHSNPELSYHEVNTAARVRKELEAAGLQVTPEVGGHGVVGVMRNGSGRTLMIRTDLDGLPVTEETGLPYASGIRTKDDQGNEVGVMHACGHDMHMTCFIGTARLMARLKDRWKGTLLMIGQPAEERTGGALAMLKEGLYQKFARPDFALALHNDASLETGKVGICEGDALAGTDSVDLTIRGVGGHGAFPYTTKDPIVLAAQTILALQTIVSREIRAIDPAVVTVGSIHGGTKHNIIPDEVQLQLTIRYYSESMRAHLLGSIERIARGFAQAAGVPAERAPTLKVERGATPTRNTPELARRVSKAIGSVLGEAKIVSREPVMGGEDFGYYGQTPEQVPITLFWLGTVNPERVKESQRGGKALPSLHSNLFAPVPETTIKTGVTAMTAAALNLLQ